jgi:hypothetical protein
MQYVFLAVVLTGMAVRLGQIWFRRRREAPLRREIRSQEVAFWVSLPQVKVNEGYGWPRWLSLNTSMVGMEYYFKACETSIGTSREPSRNSAMNWIVVTGRQRSQEIKLAITHGDEGLLHDAWNARVAAGAVSVGPAQADPARWRTDTAPRGE